jgi:hypothetical protein
VQVIATGASVAGNMMARNPQLGAEYKLLLKDSPNFIGVAKGEDKLRLKVNEIIAAAKAAATSTRWPEVAGPPGRRPAPSEAPSAPPSCRACHQGGHLRPAKLPHRLSPPPRLPVDLPRPA